MSRRSIMTENDYIEYKKLLKTLQGERRFNHSVNVSIQCEQLATRYRYDVIKAKIAGLLHDITKEMPISNQLEILKQNNIRCDNIQLLNTGLIHPVSGCVYIQQRLNIHDLDIINAIRYHTTGRENMSLLEKIVCVADHISPERRHPEVYKVREMAFKNLDMAVIEKLKTAMHNNLNKSAIIHPDTILAYNYILMGRAG